MNLFQQAREEAMQRACESEEARAPGFCERATDFLKRYAATGREFLGEELIAAAEREGLHAENPKAWGNVVRMAAKAGLIVHTGRFSLKTTNGSPKKIWKSPTPIPSESKSA